MNADADTGELARRVIDSFSDAGLTLASCESITAGGIGWALTQIPGSSQVYRGGLITYASDLKVSLAGVDADFVAAHGVINERTAREMAIGAARVCRADVAVSVTGTAGPTGEDGVGPGVVWAGLSGPCGVQTQCYELTGGRDQIRRQTVRLILKKLLSIV